MIYVISDTHFGHKNILKFEQFYRPFSSIEEHNEELVNRWNSVVTPKDTVWHLGDVAFGRANLHKYMPMLNGTKKLVLGNHDNYRIQEYLLHFKEVVGCIDRYKVIFTHFPVHAQQLEARYVTNVHGHLHSKKLNDSRYVNVSCENINLTPISLDLILNPV